MTIQYVLAGSGICTGIATLLSAVLIQQHMRYFSKPLVQSKIVGILWMVPIYSIDSWLSLSFKDYALYLDMIRDCYEVRRSHGGCILLHVPPQSGTPGSRSIPLPCNETQAYVLYLFLALLMAYLGDGDELKVIELVEQQPRVCETYMKIPLYPHTLMHNHTLGQPYSMPSGMSVEACQPARPALGLTAHGPLSTPISAT